MDSAGAQADAYPTLQVMFIVAPSERLVVYSKLPFMMFGGPHDFPGRANDQRQRYLIA